MALPCSFNKILRFNLLVRGLTKLTGCGKPSYLALKRPQTKTQGNRKPRVQTEKTQMESQQGRWKPRNQLKAKMKAEMYIKGETNYSLADVLC
jgi:hypothetical protein